MLAVVIVVVVVGADDVGEMIIVLMILVMLVMLMMIMGAGILFMLTVCFPNNLSSSASALRYLGSTANTLRLLFLLVSDWLLSSPDARCEEGTPYLQIYASKHKYNTTRNHSPPHHNHNYHHNHNHNHTTTTTTAHGSCRRHMSNHMHGNTPARTRRVFSWLTVVWFGQCLLPHLVAGLYPWPCPVLLVSLPCFVASFASSFSFS